ncbi:RNA polymerase recycling motor HelD [Brassicibacter mesophilus]|uniref:RNA polymerase recycling motor HelD n=1 Tax=Brassicibacter mesophilus TaxID=745119 RepID=UPI003D1B9B1A
MNFSKDEITYEEKKLHKTLTQIDFDLKEQKKYYEIFKKEALSIQKEMFEEITSTPVELWEVNDAAQLWYYQNEIEREGRKIILSESMVRKLEKMQFSPYFGRIDFKENGEDKAESFYIGIGSILESDTHDYMVIDWRAPVSSMFYDYEVGKAEYKSPNSTIEGNLTLKRQYKIENGKMLYMLNSSLKIDDEILQEILSKNVDNKMKSIVTSIQLEQNRVIRDEKNHVMVVQGPAGSGKTSIALHRIAYLLYRYQKSMNPKNIVIFSPNSVFNDYISTVLPELGEENMFQTTFVDYAEKFLELTAELEDMGDQMNFLLSNQNSEKYIQRIKNIEFKVSEAFIDILNNYIRYVETESIVFEDIYYKDNLLASKEELYNLLVNEYSFRPFSKRLEMVRNRVLFLLKPFEDKRFQEVYNYIKKRDTFNTDEVIRAKVYSIIRDEFNPIKDSIREKTTFNLVDIYLNLFNNEELFRKSNKGILPDFFNQIRKETNKLTETNKINYEDGIALVYLKLILDGSPSNSAIRHVVVDECQDYTILQYMSFKLLFADSSFTLLGDLNQSISPYMNIGKYTRITKLFEGKITSILTLNKSYRSTSEISQFTRALLGEKHEWEYLERSGVKPTLVKVSNADILNKVLDVANHLKKEGFASIAIICKTLNESIDVHKALKKYINVHLIKNDDIKYPKGTVVVPSYLAKGLEFDAVIVYTCNEETYGSENEKQLLYTICTRALHRLYVFYSDNLSPFIKRLDKSLYIKLD